MGGRRALARERAPRGTSRTRTLLCGSGATGARRSGGRGHRGLRALAGSAGRSLVRCSRVRREGCRRPATGTGPDALLTGAYRPHAFGATTRGCCAPSRSSGRVPTARECLARSRPRPPQTRPRGTPGRAELGVEAYGRPRRGDRGASRNARGPGRRARARFGRLACAPWPPRRGRPALTDRGPGRGAGDAASADRCGAGARLRRRAAAVTAGRAACGRGGRPAAAGGSGTRRPLGRGRRAWYRLGRPYKARTAAGAGRASSSPAVPAGDHPVARGLSGPRTVGAAACAGAELFAQRCRSTWPPAPPASPDAAARWAHRPVGGVRGCYPRIPPGDRRRSGHEPSRELPRHAHHAQALSPPSRAAWRTARIRR